MNGSQECRHVGFIASLSNGETLFENPEISWENVVERCRNENLKITQLRVQAFGLNMTPLRDGGDGVMPITGRIVSKRSGNFKLVRGIGNLIGKSLLCLLSDESRNVWVEVRSIKDSDVLYSDKR